MKYRQQFDSSDCGAACFSMIASFYGLNLNSAEIRQFAGTDVNGSSLQGLINCGKEYNLRGRVYKGDITHLTKSVYTPFIAHLYIQKENNSINHYVVIKKISKKYIYVWDPDVTQKKKRQKKDEFQKQWSGYSIFFEPTIDFKKSKKNNLLIKFLPVFFPHKKILIFSFLSSVLLLFFGIAVSFYYKYLFDEIIFSKAEFSLHSLSLCVLLVIILQSVIGLIRSVLLSHFSYKTDLTLNFSYLSHIMKLPVSFFESRKVGEILSRLGDLEKIKQSLSSTVISGSMDLIMLFVSGPILLKINSKLFITSFMCTLIIALSSIIFAKVYKHYYAISMGLNADVQSYLHESINGILTVKAMNAEQIVIDDYENKKMKVVDTSWRLNKYKMAQSFINHMITGLCGIVVYWIGSYAILKGTLSFGTLITFNSLLVYFTGPIYRLLNIQNNLQESLVAAERVGEILELECEKKTSNLIKLKKIDGGIKFENVTFAYGSKLPLFSELNINIEPQKWTAIVGPSGCGKSTIVKMLLKFYEPQSGKIYVDGNDINEIDTDDLRIRIGYVPQEIFLFSGTIADNISMHNPNASIEEIMEISKKTKAHEFIEKLPNKYNTILGEHGCGLSGGEKQRLALTRALLGNPNLIVLDEATSNLDAISEMEIHNVIKQLKKNKVAVLLIAHRLSTIINCDTIYVLNDGKVIQKGNHKDLIKLDGLYRKMWLESNKNYCD